MCVCVCVFVDILVTTPSRLVHMLSQEPPTIQLNKSVNSPPSSPLLSICISCMYISNLTHIQHYTMSIIRLLYSVEWLILDEADKLFEDGTNDSGFRQQVYTYIHPPIL